MIATIINVEVKQARFRKDVNYFAITLLDDYETRIFGNLAIIERQMNAFFKRNKIYFVDEWNPKDLIGMIISVERRWEPYQDKMIHRTILNLEY